LSILEHQKNQAIVREIHKKDVLLAAALRYPILWDGHLARPCIISKMPAPQEILGYFFIWKSLNCFVSDLR
jgi:hypothetical protein